jgi:hypothetical protein
MEVTSRTNGTSDLKLLNKPATVGGMNVMISKYNTSQQLDRSSKQFTSNISQQMNQLSSSMTSRNIPIIDR